VRYKEWALKETTKNSRHKGFRQEKKQGGGASGHIVGQSPTLHRSGGSLPFNNLCKKGPKVRAKGSAHRAPQKCVEEKKKLGLANCPGMLKGPLKRRPSGISAFEKKKNLANMQEKTCSLVSNKEKQVKSGWLC